jgi:hypothetical protein
VLAPGKCHVESWSSWSSAVIYRILSSIFVMEEQNAKGNESYQLPKFMCKSALNFCYLEYFILVMHLEGVFQLQFGDFVQNC